MNKPNTINEAYNELKVKFEAHENTRKDSRRFADFVGLREYYNLLAFMANSLTEKLDPNMNDFTYESVGWTKEMVDLLLPIKTSLTGMGMDRLGEPWDDSSENLTKEKREQFARTHDKGPLQWFPHVISILCVFFGISLTSLEARSGHKTFIKNEARFNATLNTRDSITHAHFKALLWSMQKLLPKEDLARYIEGIEEVINAASSNNTLNFNQSAVAEWRQALQAIKNTLDPNQNLDTKIIANAVQIGGEKANPYPKIEQRINQINNSNATILQNPHANNPKPQPLQLGGVEGEIERVREESARVGELLTTLQAKKRVQDAFYKNAQKELGTIQEILEKIRDEITKITSKREENQGTQALDVLKLNDISSITGDVFEIINSFNTTLTLTVISGVVRVLYIIEGLTESNTVIATLKETIYTNINQFRPDLAQDIKNLEQAIENDTNETRKDKKRSLLSELQKLQQIKTEADNIIEVQEDEITSLTTEAEKRKDEQIKLQNQLNDLKEQAVVQSVQNGGFDAQIKGAKNKRWLSFLPCVNDSNTITTKSTIEGQKIKITLDNFSDNGQHVFEHLQSKYSVQADLKSCRYWRDEVIISKEQAQKILFTTQTR